MSAMSPFECEKEKNLGKGKASPKKKSCIPVTFLSLGVFEERGKKGGGMATAKEIFSQEREREGTLPGFPGRKKKPKLSSRVSFFVALHTGNGKGRKEGFVEKNARR